MAEPGFEVIVKINLPPEKQYHSGHSIIVQGHTVKDVELSLDELAGTEGNGKVILATFAEFALVKGAETVLKSVGASAATVEAGGNPATADASAGASATTEAKPASKNLLKLVAKKTGKDITELVKEGLTITQATALLKEEAS